MATVQARSRDQPAKRLKPVNSPEREIRAQKKHPPVLSVLIALMGTSEALSLILFMPPSTVANANSSASWPISFQFVW